MVQKDSKEAADMKKLERDGFEPEIVGFVLQS